MKPVSFILILLLLAVCVSGCAAQTEAANIAATTLPVYQFTSMLCDGTDLTVTRLVTESVSCLHDYSLNVRQVKATESADLIVINGAGLEEFMEDILDGKQTIDASTGIALLESCHSHSEEGHDDHHHHEQDSHIWLSPTNAMVMARNICDGLTCQYPEYADVFAQNLTSLLSRLQQLQDYGTAQLANLSCRELVTFHDGFAYFADCFGLEILSAVEEESGSEVSAHQLTELIELVRTHELQAIFTETNGSDASAKVIAAETGAALYALDMAMSGDDYFEAMYRNIDTIKEALE